MTAPDRQNDAMMRLASKYHLEEGMGLDYYRHKQSGKFLITKAGIERIALEEAIAPFAAPTLTVCPDRIVVGGWMSRPAKVEGTVETQPEAQVWTTGEARFQGKAVEGSHSAAMAEKRWRTRAVLMLVTQAGETIYGEDEFNDDFLKGDRGHAPSAPAAPAPQPAPAAPEQPSAPQEPRAGGWRDTIGAIARIAGFSPDKQFGDGKFAPDFYEVCLKAFGKFQGDDGNWVTVNTHSQKGTPTWEALHQKSGKWAGAAMEKAGEALKSLESGSSVRIDYDTWNSDKRCVEWRYLDIEAPMTGAIEPSSGPNASEPDPFDNADLPF